MQPPKQCSSDSENRAETAPRNRLKGGFTLIELLVVVSIIALLVAILLPALARARVTARRVACSSNMRQLLLGLNMYASEHEGYLPLDNTLMPSPYVYDGKTYTGSGGVWVPWFGAPFIGQYINNSLVTNGASNAVIYCPSLNVSDLMARPSYDATKNRNGIGINRTASGPAGVTNCNLYDDKGHHTRWDGIASPSRMAILTDAAYGGYTGGYFSWGYITQDVNGLPNDPGLVNRQASYGDNAYFHHMGLCNLGFADGHVDCYSDVVAAWRSKEITNDATK